MIIENTLSTFVYAKLDSVHENGEIIWAISQKEYPNVQMELNVKYVTPKLDYLTLEFSISNYVHFMLTYIWYPVFL